MATEIPTSNRSSGANSAPVRELSREQHGISRKQLSRGALKVIYALHDAGHDAYLVGGSVRDLLLGGAPKDFDVATDATPEQVKAVFQRARIVGRRFRIAHVRVGGEIVEVTTFRASHPDNHSGDHRAAANEHGMLLRDNIYGDLHDDALRRDFTINSLYYSIDGFKVLDYTGGYDDLQQRTLRIVGDPSQRYQEDPVRMLRALRFAAKLDFSIEADTADAIPACAHHLAQVSTARLFDETIKLMMSGYSARTFVLLRDYGLLRWLFPTLVERLERANSASHAIAWALIQAALASTDRRIAENMPVTPSFVLAALLWPVVAERATRHQHANNDNLSALQLAGREVIARQLETLSIPKRFTLTVLEIWVLQARLAGIAEKDQRKRALVLTRHRWFRAAFDFLLLREQTGEVTTSHSEWWARFQSDHAAAIDPPVEHKPATRRRRPRRRRHTSAGGNGDGN